MLEILKGVPLIVGILLNIILPFVLNEKAHEYATDGTLIKSKKSENRNPHDTLDYVIQWRDLIIAVFTGIFVLQFAAAEDITSTSQKLAFIPLPFKWHLSDVAIAFTVILVPLLLILAFILSLKLKSTSVQSAFQYWVKFSFLVIPLYAVSCLFVYSA
jgi:hypothetical protein